MALLQLVIHKKLFINHCKYDKLYLITIFISSEIDGRRIYVRMKTTTMSEQMGIWFIATQKKDISLQSQAVHRPSNSIELFQMLLKEFFMFHFRHVSMRIFVLFPSHDLLNEDFVVVSVTQFQLWQQEKNEHRMEKNVSQPTVPHYWILLMSRTTTTTTQNKKQVKLNIEDLISQSLSYVIARSTRDGREKKIREIPPIGYLLLPTFLLLLSSQCCVCVCVIYNVSCVCVLEWRLNCEAKCLTIKFLQYKLSPFIVSRFFYSPILT